MIQGVEARIVRRGRSPVDRLSEVFGERVQFCSTCLDRIVLHGYLTGLQRPGQLVHFFHDVVGVDCIEPKVLLGRTTEYREWVDRSAQGQGIAVLAAPKGVRKEELVRPYYGKLGPREGIACVLTSLENNRTFISYACISHMRVLFKTGGSIWLSTYPVAPYPR
jgi:hypothetical protein